MDPCADVETSSDTYALRFAGDVGAWFLRVQEHGVLRLIARSPGATSVLDVGGGHGQLAEPLTAHGYAVTILGSNASTKHRVKSLCDSGEAAFAIGRPEQIPFENQSFDTVTSIRLLTHSPDWRTVIGELCRVAKDQVIIDYPPRRSFNIFYDALFALKKGAEGDTRPFTIFSDDQIRDAFAQHGFNQEGHIPQFFLPMVAYRKLGSSRFGSFFEGFFRIIGLTGIFGSPTLVRFVRSKH